MNYRHDQLTDRFPLLAKLREKRVFGVYPCPKVAFTEGEETTIDGVVLEEECDNYFYETLTNAELRQLADELTQLADKLLEPGEWHAYRSGRP